MKKKSTTMNKIHMNKKLQKKDKSMNIKLKIKKKFIFKKKR